MQFTYQALTWGFLIALVPLLIHLINMMRHRKVKWAAMEFLLRSYKKHRKWVWLKQLLLLLMRMAVIALLVGLLAQWDPQNSWLSRFGGQVTHHYVLVDDSYSMSDTDGQQSAFETALQVMTRIGNQAATTGQQRFTLLRFSRAVDAADESGQTPLDRLDSIVDLNAEFVDKDFGELLEERQTKFQVSQFAIDPLPALNLVKQLVADDRRENRIVYVISDFRESDWESPSQIKEALENLAERCEDIHLVRCSEQPHHNLGITQLTAADGTRAAGVPLFINVQVHNYGQQAATRVPVTLRTVFHQDDQIKEVNADQLDGQEDLLPTMLIDRIAPGETVSERFQVYFPESGQHVVQASLPDDAVQADNQRWTVIDFPEGDPVLVIDGSPGKLHQYYLTSCFEPGQRANTGIRPQLEDIQWLRDHGPEDLQRFSAIYLMDVGRLDPTAYDSLEKFVRGGGGLGIFLGDQVDVQHYNSQFYRDGDGLLPARLAGMSILESPFDSNTSDIDVLDHPVFDFFLGERNPLIRRVSIEQFIQPDVNWKPAPGSGARVVTRLHNGQPLVVERRFGNGRVVCFLTSVAPTWNNWAQDPSFVVVTLKLHAYLTAVSRVDRGRLVGDPIEVTLPRAEHSGDVTFFQPAETAALRSELERKAEALQSDATASTTVAALGVNSEHSPRRLETGQSGIYEAVYRHLEEGLQVKRFALNVDGQEGSMALAEDEQLAARLDSVQFQLNRPDDYLGASMIQAGGSTGFWLLWLLIAMLMAEQILAYSASYHPASKGGGR